MTNSNLVSTEWLGENLENPDIVIVDGSWYLPTESRDTYAEFKKKHIPGAVFFDIDKIKDNESPLPHMLPPPEEFSSAIQELGISDGQTVVVYDTAGMFSAPRVWWTFKVMGFESVKVLNGGFPKWNSEGRPVTDEIIKKSGGTFTANFNKELVVDLQYMTGNFQKDGFQIADARPQDRFTGETPEPRPGLRSGHIPGSVNIPFTQMIDENGCMKSNMELTNSFNKSGLDMEKPVVASCGSGLAAGILVLAMTELGKNDYSIYDGSWTEWGGKHDLPIETGSK